MSRARWFRTETSGWALPSVPASSWIRPENESQSWQKVARVKDWAKLDDKSNPPRSELDTLIFFCNPIEKHKHGCKIVLFNSHCASYGKQAFHIFFFTKWSTFDRISPPPVLFFMVVASCDPDCVKLLVANFFLMKVLLDLTKLS